MRLESNRGQGVPSMRFESTVRAVAGALSLAFAATTAFAADATGRWAGEVKLPNGQSLPLVATLKQEGATVTGKLDGIGGAPDVPILDGKVDKDVVTFFSVRPVNNASVRFAYTGRMSDGA